MNTQPGIYTLRQGGMTLIEVLVTISLLSFVMASTLTIYSRIMKTNRQGDTLALMIADADRIMTTVEQDIRNARSIVTQYELKGNYAVIAALPRSKSSPLPATIVYALDTEQPNRLFRVAVGNNAVNATELSTNVLSLKIVPTSESLVNVELILEHTVGGEVKTWRVSSAFARALAELEVNKHNLAS